MINLVSSCWQIRDYKRLDTIQITLDRATLMKTSSVKYQVRRCGLLDKTFSLYAHLRYFMR